MKRARDFFPTKDALASEQQSHDAEIYRIADALGLLSPGTATIEEIVKAIKALKRAAE